MSFWLKDLKGHSTTPYFSWNKFNLFSFDEIDHGFKDRSRSLREWALAELSKAGITNFDGEIKLVTLPRVLGYVFNPVSFWYCYEEGCLRAVIAEVNNTFGENHNYVVVNPQENVERPMEKIFHVSPFYPVQGEYRFNFSRENHASIKYFSKEGDFIAGMVGEPCEMSDIVVPKLFFTFPFYTIGVVLLIHYQALRLYLKKTPFFTKPEPPLKESSVEYID